MKDALGSVQSILVLGGASDIALATVRALVARRGRRVVLAARRPDELGGAVEDLRRAGAEQVDTVAFNADDVDAHERVVADSFEHLAPPLPLGALAVGGTARALRRVGGERLGPKEIDGAIEELLRRPSRQVSKTFKLDRQRARTITAGALILAEIQRRLNVPLEVGRGGLREGAALMLLDATVAATA